MTRLFQTEEVLTSSSLEELVKKAKHGEVLPIGEMNPKLMRPDKTFAHREGILMALEDDREFYGWFINHRQVRTTAEACLPFYETFVVRQNTDTFLIEGKNKLWEPREGERVEKNSVTPHPSGGILLSSGWQIKLLRRSKLKSLGRRVRVLSSQEFDRFEVSWDPDEPEGVVTEKEGIFCFNGEVFHRNPDFQEKYSAWRSFGKAILAEAKNGLVLYDGQNKTPVHGKVFDKCIPLPWLGTVVVTTDFELTIYRSPFQENPLKIELPYNGELIAHPFGILFRRGREFSLLVLTPEPR